MKETILLIPFLLRTVMPILVMVVLTDIRVMTQMNQMTMILVILVTLDHRNFVDLDYLMENSYLQILMRILKYFRLLKVWYANH